MRGGRARRATGFLFAGSIGFAVDAAAFWAGTAVGFSPGAARASASLVAITTTWLVNRMVTFERDHQRGTLTEYLLYFLASCAGALINLAGFLLTLQITGSLLAAYLAGTGAGLAVNYLGYSLFVFPASRPDFSGSLGQQVQGCPKGK